jgi:hypothetical protein
MLISYAMVCWVNRLGNAPTRDWREASRQTGRS